MNITKHISGLMQIPPVFTDGFLAMISAFCAAVLTYLSEKEAYEYVAPTALFWIKIVLGSSSAMISTLIAFRSKVYTQHQLQVKADTTGVAQSTTVQPVVENKTV